MPAVIVTGYWCPACRFAIRAHTDTELAACADRLERQREQAADDRSRRPS